jgi:hypothetical protein
MGEGEGGLRFVFTIVNVKKNQSFFTPIPCQSKAVAVHLFRLTREGRGDIRIRIIFFEGIVNIIPLSIKRD